jgi:hypothetical protein
MTARVKRVVWTVPGAAADRHAVAAGFLLSVSPGVFAGLAIDNE